MKVHAWSAICQHSSVQAQAPANGQIGRAAAGPTEAGARSSATSQFSRPRERTINSAWTLLACRSRGAISAVTSSSARRKRVGIIRRETGACPGTLAGTEPSCDQVNRGADFDFEIIIDGETKTGERWREQGVVTDRDG